MEYRTETEILLEMVEKAQENNLIATSNDLMDKIRNGKNTENQYILFLSVLAYFQAIAEKKSAEIEENTNINIATGEALDNLGELLDVYRGTAQPPTCDILIRLPTEASEEIVIPSGSNVILKDIYADYGEYKTIEDLVIFTGNDSITTTIEGEYGFNPALPIGAVQGLEDYPELIVTNESEGTNGKNIEEDEDYRERIKDWGAKTIIGTKSCIEDYLTHYNGVDSFKLIPMYDGVGTLKIIVDALPSELSKISDDVYENCMVITDSKPLVEIPENTVIEKLIMNVTLKQYPSIIEDELTKLLKSQTNVYINGGITRGLNTVHGLNIGETFYPSLFIKFLLSEFTEINNLYLELEENEEPIPFNTPLEIGENKLLTIQDIVVVYE